jgi:hypothetical protein
MKMWNMTLSLKAASPEFADAFRAVRAIAEPAGMTVNADIHK